MSGSDPATRVSTVHVGGVAVVRVRGRLDADIAPALVAQVAPELSADARVVLDLDSGDIDPVTGVAVVQEVLDLAAASAATILVVSAHPSARELLRAAGVEVHESLDEALADDVPVLRHAATPPPQDRLLPAGGDALLVATDDLAAPDRDR